MASPAHQVGSTFVAPASSHFFAAEAAAIAATLPVVPIGVAAPLNVRVRAKFYEEWLLLWRAQIPAADPSGASHQRLRISRIHSQPLQRFADSSYSWCVRCLLNINNPATVQRRTVRVNSAFCVLGAGCEVARAARIPVDFSGNVVGKQAHAG